MWSSNIPYTHTEYNYENEYSLYPHPNTIIRIKAEAYMSLPLETVEGNWICDLLIVEFLMPP